MSLIKKILIFLILLNFSWIFPLTRNLWNALDTHFFFFLNALIENSLFLQTFWAVASQRLVDQASEIVMVFLAICYVYSGNEEEVGKRWKEVGFLILSVFCAFLVSKFLLTALIKGLGFKRASPTLVYPDAFRLSQTSLSVGIKDLSNQSFPGDHAIVLMTWAWMLCYFWGRKSAPLIAGVVIFFSLPRLFAGAHWPTDILIGSTTISLLVFLAAASYQSYLYKKSSGA